MAKSEVGSPELIQPCVSELWEGDNYGLSYLRSVGITDELIQRYKLGFFKNQQAIILPVATTKNEFKGYWFHKVSAQGVRAWGKPDRIVSVYPPSFKKEPLLICWHPIDALVALSLGLNAVSVFKRVFPRALRGTLKEVRRCYTVFPSRSDAAALMRQVRNDETRVFTIESKGLADDLIGADDPQAELRKMVDGAQEVIAPSTESSGLYELDGKLFSHERPVAEFTGRVIRTGLRREGNETLIGRSFLLELEHQNGGVLTVEHFQEDSFYDSVLRSPGCEPKWLFNRRNADAIFTFLAQSSIPGTYETKDTGYVFGWVKDERLKGDQLERFIGPEAVIHKGVVSANEEIHLEPPVDFFRRFRLPHTDPEQLGEGLNLLLGDCYNSHHHTFMGPLLAASIIAPVRRVLLPSMPRFIIFIRGRPGCGKTTRAMLAQNLFGDFPNEQHVMGFTSTPNAVEHLLAVSGDCFVAVDDFNPDRLSPAEKQGHQRWMQGLQTMARSRLDRSGKGLVSSGSGHSIIGVTLEQLPLGDAALIARSLVLDVPVPLSRDTGEQDAYDRAMGQRSLLGHVLTSWVAEVSSKTPPMSATSQRRGFLKETVRGHMDASNPHWFRIQSAQRLESRLVDLSWGWDQFLTWAGRQTYGPGSMRCHDLKDEWVAQILPSLCRKNLNEYEGSGATFDFMEKVWVEITSGSAVVINKGTNKALPTRAHGHAVAIGYIATVRKTDAEAFPLRGSWTQLYFFSGISKLDSTRSWPQVKTYLVDNDVITGKQIKARLGTFRAHSFLVKRPHAERFVEELMSLEDKRDITPLPSDPTGP